MRRSFLLIPAFAVLIASSAFSQTPVFINELHYDNAGGDTGEGAEVAGPAGTDLSLWQIVGYNGTGGVTYATTYLAGLIPDLGGGYGTIWFPIVGIQNGPPDALALVDNGVVVQFLSYEGTLTATNGPANGMLSVNIGVSESLSTPIGSSLQLGGSGTEYEDFFWQTEAASTYDAFNSFQAFVGPYPTPPGSGDALDFDGVDDYVNLDAVSLDMVGEHGSFAMEAWFKIPSGATAASDVIFSVGTNLGGNIIHAKVLAGGAIALFDNPGGNVIIGSIVDDNVWHHVCFTRQGGGGSLYLNGVLQGTYGASFSIPFNSLWALGQEYDAGPTPSNFFEGQIDEVRIWSSSITETEIRDHMCKKDLSAHPQIANLVANYRMDDGAGSSALVDISGNGNVGALINMDPGTDWVTSGAAIGDESSQGYGVATVSHTSGTVFTADTYTGTPDGVHVYKVNEAPNDVTIPASYVSIETTEYYGVHVVGGTSPTYTARLDYTTNANINSQPNESDVRLLDRVNNASGQFVDLIGQTTSTALNIIEALVQVSSEFIPGFAVPPSCVDYFLEFRNDATPGEITWEVWDATGTTMVESGTNPFPANSSGTLTVCLTNGCFQLRVLDSAGDGITSGGYTLRDGTGQRIIDADGMFGSSSIAPSFCLPLGDDRYLASRCDKLDYLPNEQIIASQNPAVAAQHGISDQTDDGYQFWLFDPHGTYSRRVFYSNGDPQNGAPPGVTAAQHLRFGLLQSLPVPSGLLLNIRVRGRVNGVYQEFGPACRFKVDAVSATCPTTNLIDDPNHQFFSCGITDVSLAGSDKIVAQPVAGANRYQFEFALASEGYLRRIAKPSYVLPLNVWYTSPLQYAKTYEVRVRASFDNGTSYCSWGDVCMLSTAPVPPATASVRSLSVPETASITLWPNPNNGDQVNLMMTNVDGSTQTVGIEIYDAFGKRVSASNYSPQGGILNTLIDLNNELAIGLYVVRINVGERAFVERLVIE